MKLFLFIAVIFQMSFAQSQTGELTGTVVNENGEVIPFARVLVYDLGRFVGGTETDFDGKFKILNLAPGSYDVEFSAYFDDMDTLRLTEVRIYPERITSLVEVRMDQLYNNIIDCDFGLELTPPIKLDPFGGPTIVEPEDIRRP